MDRTVVSNNKGKESTPLNPQLYIKQVPTDRSFTTFQYLGPYTKKLDLDVVSL